MTEQHVTDDRRRSHRLVIGATGMLLLAGMVGVSPGQTSNRDEMIDSIRPLGQIGQSDQRRIGDWVQEEIEQLEKTPAGQRAAAAIKFRERFREQYEHSGNSAAFRQEFPRQTAATAATFLAKSNLDPTVSRAIGRVLLDMASPEMTAAAAVGLGSRDAATRYFCAQLLATQRQAIASDKETLDRTVKTVREAGAVETSPVVLSRLYQSMQVPPAQAGAVFDAYMAIFTKRLEARVGPDLIADGAEVDAFEFFRNAAVLGALSEQQKEQLARVTARFLRLDAQRYGMGGLKFDEVNILERTLDAEEEILAGLAGSGKGGNIREVLSSGGYERRGDVVAQADLWIGNAETQQAGALNAAPWNVPLGAP